MLSGYIFGFALAVIVFEILSVLGQNDSNREKSGFEMKTPRVKTVFVSK